MSAVKFLTLNVRGLRNQEKRRSIFSYLKKQKANIYLLQETFSNLKDERIWSEEWGAQIFYSHGSDHSKGVCVLIKPNSPIHVEIVELVTPTSSYNRVLIYTKHFVFLLLERQ